MNKENRFLNKFTTFDIIIMSLISGIGLAIKPFILPLTHMITGPLFIPGGAVAGGLYMMWIVLAASIVNKRGAGTFTAFTQGLIVIITGSFGSHGLISILTYTLPGLGIDLFLIFFNRKFASGLDFFISGIIANITGTYISNLIFFRLPLIPLVLSLSSSVLSGALGGIIAYKIYKKISLINLSGVAYEKIK